MNIIRRYKIHLINKKCLTETELEDLNMIFNHVKYSKENYEVIDFMYNNFFNLEQVKFKKYPYYLFYFREDNDKFIFRQDLNSSWVGVNDDLIWSVFEDKFGYNYKEIETLIKSIVEQIYKLNSIFPHKIGNIDKYRY